jgi:Protein of unknown function (DUF3617)
MLEANLRVAHGLAGVAFAAGAMAVAPARAEPLAVTPGLWQVTAEVAGGALAAMPQLLANQLSKLTPEQQAKLQQYAAGAAGGIALTHRICVTPALLQHPLTGPGGPHNCTRTLVSSSATTLELQLSCTGAQHGTGTLRLTVADPRTVNGTIDAQLTTKDGTTIPIHHTLQSHWLAADCGGVKSIE